MSHGIAATIWMGGPSRRSFEVLGDVTNTAARTLSRARWGEVLVTSTLRDRLPSFAAKPRGRHAVQGKSAPLDLFAVTGVLPRASPGEMRSRLVGRSPEVAALLAVLLEVLRGTSRVVALAGQAGTGKSRLAWELAAHAQERGMLVHRGRCRAFGARSYEPFADLLRSELGIREAARPDEVARALAKMSALDERSRHHLADVLSARTEDSPLVHLDAETLRRNDAAALAAWFGELCRHAPRLFVLEDLHWADEATRDAIPRVARALGGQAALLLLVHRPGYAAPAVDLSIELAELPAPDAEELVAGILGGATPRLVSAVVEQAGGNPFFIEEVVRYLRDRDRLVTRTDGTLDLAAAPEIPQSVESVLEARLSELPPPARRLVDVGAVIGRRFPRDLLASFPELRRGLDASVRTLQARQLIFQEDATTPDAGFVFKHSLTRDVAYAGILVADRRRIHRTVALSLERRATSASDGQLGLLGHHWEGAGDPARARGSYLAAGREAAALGASAEAERHFRSWLRLDDGTDPQAARATLELAEVLALTGRRGEARALHDDAARLARETGLRDVHASALKGRAMADLTAGRIDDAERSLEEALDVLPRGSFATVRAAVLSSIGNILRQRGRRDEAMRTYRRALALLRREGDVRGGAVVLRTLGVSAYEQGRKRLAERYYRKALAGHRAAEDRAGEGRALANLGALAFDSGRHDESEAILREALAIQVAIGNRPSEGVVLGHLATLQRQRMEVPAAIATSRRALQIARDVEDREREAMWLSNIGSLESLAGRHGLARDAHREAVAIALRLVTPLATHYLARWAHFEYADGRLATARRLVESARRRLARRPDPHDARLLEQISGCIAGDRGELASAARSFRSTIEGAPPDSSFRSGALLLLGTLEASRGRLRQAAPCIEEAHGSYRAAGDQGGLMAVAAATARVDARRRSPSAGESLARCRDLAVASGSPKLLAELLCELAWCRIASGMDAREIGAEAAAAAAAIDVGPRSTTARALGALRRALAGTPSAPPAFRFVVALP